MAPPDIGGLRGGMALHVSVGLAGLAATAVAARTDQIRGQNGQLGENCGVLPGEPPIGPDRGKSPEAALGGKILVLKKDKPISKAE